MSSKTRQHPRTWGYSSLSKARRKGPAYISAAAFPLHFPQNHMPHQHLSITNGAGDCRRLGPGVLDEGRGRLCVPSSEDSTPWPVSPTHLPTGRIVPSLPCVVHLNCFVVDEGVNVPVPLARAPVRVFQCPLLPFCHICRRQVWFLIQRSEVDTALPKSPTDGLLTALQLHVALQRLDGDFLTPRLPQQLFVAFLSESA